MSATAVPSGAQATMSGRSEAFVSDKGADAYEKVVDRLLKDSRYGERMAMWWLDGARYADSHGFQDE